MKKVYAVGAVLAAAAVAGLMAPESGRAITIYEKDGLTYKLKGDWQIQLRQDPGHDQDLDVEYDDLEMKNSVVYQVTEQFSAYGELDFGFKNAADKSDSDDSPHLEEAFVGFRYDGYNAQIGKSSSAADEFGVEQAIETLLGDDAFDSVGATDGDDLIYVGALFNNFTVIVTHELEPDSEKSKNNGEFTDIFVGANFGPVELGAAYQDYEPYGAGGSISIWGASAIFDAKFAEFAVDYSDAEDTESLWNAFVVVPVLDTTKISLGYQYKDFDDSSLDEIGAWYVNAVYKIPSFKNVSVFAEVADTDEDNSDPGFLVGSRLTF